MSPWFQWRRHYSQNLIRLRNEPDQVDFLAWRTARSGIGRIVRSQHPAGQTATGCRRKSVAAGRPSLSRFGHRAWHLAFAPTWPGYGPWRSLVATQRSLVARAGSHRRRHRRTAASDAGPGTDKCRLGRTSAQSRRPRHHGDCMDRLSGERRSLDSDRRRRDPGGRRSAFLGRNWSYGMGRPADRRGLRRLGHRQ